VDRAGSQARGAADLAFRGFWRSSRPWYAEGQELETLKIAAYHIDAFAGAVFSGNPAMVCPLDRWLDDETLQLIARENHLPVTAFLVEHGDHHELRWFTPTIELNLCGHGTVAAAAVLFDFMDASKESVTFKTKGGTFHVVKNGELIDMDFPAHEAAPCAIKPEDLVRALGREPKEILKARNYLAVYEGEAEIRAITPDLDLLKEVDCLGAIVTARGEDSDFVSRYFAPKIGIPEDAATGSTHCTLAPYWSRRLGKRKLRAIQLSQRQGELWCESLDDRVRITARAVRYAEGFLYV
jgi:PhzF family phenazine biosynthesis protein